MAFPQVSRHLMWVPARRAAPATPAAKAVGPVVGREGARRGRGNSHLSSLGHSKFKLTPFSRLGDSRCLGLCVHPVTALCPLSLAALLSASFFFKPCLFLYLFVSVYACVSLFLIILAVSISLQLSTWLCPSASVSVSLCSSLLPSTSLYLAWSLFTNASLSLSLSLSPPSHSHSIPILWLAAWGGGRGCCCCSSPMGQPRDNSRHCLGSPSWSPPHARHLGLCLPSAAVGLGGGAREGTQCSASALDPRFP